MQKTDRMRLVELENGGRDIRELISEAFEQGGSIVEAGRLLGVDHSTLSIWISDRLNGEIVTAKREPQAVTA
jgi:transposase-like protein